MVLSPTARWLLRAAALGVLTFIYVPLALVLLNSFSASATFAWPPPGLTLRWWQVAASNEGVRTAVLTSVQVALLATVDRRRARHAGLDRARALRVLRP